MSRFIDQHDQTIVDEVFDLVGAVVVDKCGCVRLADGTVAVFNGLVNPEHNGSREFIEWSENYSIAPNITLPCVY